LKEIIMKTTIVIVVVAVAAFFGYRYFAVTSSETVRDPIVVGPVLVETPSSAASAAQ
jgi:predicted negative regulator of RcsB-dependent stress response